MHGSQLLVGLALAALGHFLGMAGHQVLNRMGQSTGLQVCGYPVGLKHIGNQCALLGCDGHQVQVPGKRGGAGLTIRPHFDKLQPTGNVFGRSGGFTHAVIKHEQHTGLGAVIMGINQHSTTLEQVAVAGQHQVCDCGHERMTGMNQISRGFAVKGALFTVKTDALVFFEYRGAGMPNDAITLNHIGWHMPDFIAACLTVAQLPTNHAERLPKKGTDEMRL